MSRLRDPACTIQISNIPLETTEINLRQLLSTFGQIISFEFDPVFRTARAARCEFADAEIAKVAVRDLNGHLLKGKALGVSFMDKFASKQTSQQVIGSLINREMTQRPIIGDKNTSINDNTIQNIIVSMTEREQAEVLCEFKHLAMNHPEQIRDLLIESPQFAHTILSLMTMYQLIDTDAIDKFASDNNQSAQLLQNQSTVPNNQTMTQQQQQQQQQGGLASLSQGEMNNVLLKLTPPERDFYVKWQNYNEQQRSSLRTALAAPGAAQDAKIGKVIQIWESLQIKLGVKL